MIAPRARVGFAGTMRYGARFADGNGNWGPLPCRGCDGPKDNAPGSPFCKACRDRRAARKRTAPTLDDKLAAAAVITRARLEVVADVANFDAADQRSMRRADESTARAAVALSETLWTVPLALRWIWEQQHAT